MVPSLQLDSLPAEPQVQNPMLPGERVKRASDLISEYRTLFDEDFVAAQDRARAQSMVDGDNPYSEDELRRLGIHGITNVNWGDLRMAQREAEQPFNDILESMSSFGRVPVKQGILPEDQADRMERIIEEQLFWLITQRDEDFHFNWTLNAHYFTMWGVSFTYHTDHLDWRRHVGSMQEFKLPRGTKASINKIDRITCKVSMQPSELYRKLQSEEIINGSGWNREAIIAAVKRAQPKPLDTSDPQALQAMYKDNAVFSGNTTVVVEVVHMWVKELNGTVSHYIADYNGKDEDQFLYVKRGEFGAMDQFINAYLYGVGTNGDFHSIRGNAYSLFSSAFALNKLRCAFIDKARDEAITFLSTDNEDATIDNMLIPRGPYFQLTTGVNFVERTTPPAAHNLVPAISAMQDVFQMCSGGMAPRATATMERGQKTKYELQRRDEMEGRLSSDVMRRFFTAWGRDYREIVRRVSNPDLTQDHPGGADVLEFRRRCVEAGVPPEALVNLDYDNISLNMGIGKGSTSERRAVLDYLNNTVMPRLDQAGQRILLRDSIAAYTDARYSTLLVPDQEGMRPPVDQQIANMENQLMRLSVAPVLEPNQDHVVHCGTHILLLQEMNAAIETAEAELQDVIPQMQMAAAHATEHLQYISPTTEPYPVFKEALQQLNEVIVNGAKHIEGEARKMQKAAEAGQPAPDISGTPPGIAIQAADARARLETMQQESTFKLQAKQAEAQQKLAINDALAAQKIRHAELMNRVKMKIPTRTPAQ